MSPFPTNPTIATSLHCPGDLDEAVRSVLASLWQEANQPSLQTPAAIWAVRNSRHGEQFKVLHGPVNQLGQCQLDAASVHRLLLPATSAAAAALPRIS
jgi:hypothetical protein